MSMTIDQVVEFLGKMSVVDIANLAKRLENDWGVKAATGGGVVVAAQPGGVVAPTPVAEAAPTEFDVILKEAGGNKIAVIKEIRTITNLGLKEAKDLVEGAPKTVKEAISKEDAAKLQKQLEDAGAKVEVKPAGK